ncbi:MAG: HAD family hydrolase [Planctomycetes bacterium]|nr:HAD family hydrolase [Planctomycetota bacterium]
MAFLTTIVEYEGALANVRPRYWAAHREAIEAVGWEGPNEEEFWRLTRTGASDGLLVPRAKSAQVLEYTRRRDERRNSSDLIALDEAWPDAAVSLKLLKDMGTCHLVSLCPNREALNAALDRMAVWMYFDKKQVLPADSDRRVAALRELSGATRTLALAGTVAFAYAANEAGCRVVGLKTGLAFPRQLRQVGVDVFYDSLDSLTDALARHDPELERIGLP